MLLREKSVVVGEGGRVSGCKVSGCKVVLGFGMYGDSSRARKAALWGCSNLVLSRSASLLAKEEVHGTFRPPDSASVCRLYLGKDMVRRCASQPDRFRKTKSKEIGSNLAGHRGASKDPRMESRWVGWWASGGRLGHVMSWHTFANACVVNRDWTRGNGDAAR